MGFIIKKIKKLVTKINYPYRVVYVRFVGTHKQYDDIDVETVCRKDAASERTWTYLQRVSGDRSQFMSLFINGTAVKISFCFIIKTQRPQLHHKPAHHVAQFHHYSLTSLYRLRLFLL